ncbi:uncharacterized protein [Solanum lycopersicum]|uniref:J domain-containing protein n=1 Tax=Solanum lycopersicum TaxID=4081 RepID=A0A3Q7EGQ5_SOLLC|nr:uncharacterized protein LOC101248043 [Solanum lycopersicum]
MDCNKEEAIKARGMAEVMMRNRDFVGAKKFASKAQKLFPDLENITQMVSICEVHCSAEKTSFGNEKDWYSILKVEPTADDALIRKQYRKFALLLHPDKNKFPGAADAFSLIGEAISVLLDGPKRTLYNSRHIPSGRFQVPMQHKSCQPDTRKHHKVTQSGAPESEPTFWTICPCCSIKYKYHKTFLNQLLRCPNSKKSYRGYEVNDSVATPGTSRSQPTSSQKKGADETLARNSFIQPEFPSEVSQESNRNGKSDNAYRKMNKEGLSGEYKRKNTERKKISIESSEKCDLSEDTNFEVDTHVPGQKSQCLTRENQRRSTRCRQHVTHRDNLSDEDEEEGPSKRSKGVGYPSPTKESEVQHLSHAATPKGKEKKLKDSLSSEERLQNTEQEAETANGRVDLPLKGSVDCPSDVGASAMAEPKIYQCADPDFSDFDKDKEESCFKVGQVWAIYDSLDAMPRFYAVISKIVSPAFKLSITWLEPDPLNEDETKWLSEGLPASCGRFRKGNLEDIEDLPMFSHLVCAINRHSCGAIKIFPLQGETWAIFRDWDLNWCSGLERKKKFKYDFVEVLSDFADAIGVHVVKLVKANGFTCLFHRAGHPFVVPAKEMLRFSHRVPSFKMTGMERNDVPEGSFELDPASLPTDQVGISASSLDERERGNFMAYDHMDSAEKCVGSVPDQVAEPIFYCFDAERSPEKFEVGQYWAMYSDEDGLPRYYGLIKKIDLLPDFVLHVAWLYACPPPKGTTQWHDETMPIGCGQFKFRNSKLKPYTGTATFSHEVAAEVLKKGLYKIFPGKGEVWAVYKNWSAKIKGKKLEDCEYEIVEIVDVSTSYIQVKLLVRVQGFKSVYKPQVEEEGRVKISMSDHLKFSHGIPAFRLTEERGGSLRGFWELDPAAMPLYLLCTD